MYWIHLNRTCLIELSNTSDEVWKIKLFIRIYRKISPKGAVHELLNSLLNFFCLCLWGVLHALTFSIKRNLRELLNAFVYFYLFNLKVFWGHCMLHCQFLLLRIIALMHCTISKLLILFSKGFYFEMDYFLTRPLLFSIVTIAKINLYLVNMKIALFLQCTQIQISIQIRYCIQ